MTSQGLKITKLKLKGEEMILIYEMYCACLTLGQTLILLSTQVGIEYKG